MILWEILTLKKLIKSINEIRTDVTKGVQVVKEKITEIETRLNPLINALNKATPFLEVFNAITGIFSKHRKRKEEKNG